MIGSVKQEGNSVRVLDEKGLTLFLQWGKVIGYTSTTVTIRSNNGDLWVYDEKGRVIKGLGK